MRTMINLGLLMKVLKKYNADEQPDGSPEREAWENLTSCCEFELNQKVAYQHKKGWVSGVVVAYIISPPSYVIGKGDDKNNLKSDKMWGIDARQIRPRADIKEEDLIDWPEE